MPNGAFLTQVPGQASSNARTHSDEINELEALVSGVTQISQSTLLLKKKKEMQEVNKSLAFMKDWYLDNMKTADEKHAVFERDQLDLKNQVVKFEKFIQENDSKRQRALTRKQQEVQSAKTGLARETARTEKAETKIDLELDTHRSVNQAIRDNAKNPVSVVIK